MTASKHAAEWRKLPVTLTELCLDRTLRCGQSFRWKKLADDEWTCALHGRILSLKQDPEHVNYRATWPLNKPAAVDDTESLLHHYFNLTPNLTKLYEQWSLADANFKKRAPKFTGIRILRQDAWEALVGFICSSNNNIARISQMVNNLCLHYGPFIGHIGETPIHDFPTPEALSGPKVESHLRELGFGYRAKYIATTARMVVNDRPAGWLEGLVNGAGSTYREAHNQLLELQGVGPKVADCVCLMGLGWGEAVPVDTHVWQIAQRDYKFGKGKFKSLNKATYDAIGDHFRELWGKEAGWAHSVLFTADLKTFAERPEVKVEVKTEVKVEDGVVVEKKIKREFALEDVFKAEDVKIEDVVKVEDVAELPRKRRRAR